MIHTFDMHAHTIYSDGTKDRHQITELLQKHNKIWTVTDHDNMDFHAQENQAYCSGIEISTYAECCGKSGTEEIYPIELLAYNFKVPELKHELEWYLIEKSNIQNKILGKLKAKAKQIGCKFDVGIEISEIPFAHATLYTELKRYAENESILGKEALESDDKFYRISQTAGAPLYIDTREYFFSPEEVYSKVKKCGGVVVLAHPCRNKGAEEKVVDSICKYLDGIEVLHPSTPSVDRACQLLDLCRDKGLKATGGTDYHNGEYRGTPFFDTVVEKYADRFDWIIDLCRK